MTDARPAPDTTAPAGAVAPEFLAWAAQHQRQRRRHAADLAQITQHPDPHQHADALAQQVAWARRQQRDHRLHHSALTQIRFQRSR